MKKDHLISIRRRDKISARGRMSVTHITYMDLFLTHAYVKAETTPKDKYIEKHRLIKTRNCALVLYKMHIHSAGDISHT